MKVAHLPFLLFLSLLFSIFSCKKDNGAKTDIKFPLTLYVNQLTQKGAVKVYTANGEITDADKIDRFLGQQRSYFNRTYTPGDTSSMRFINRDTAMFSSSTTKYSVNYKNEQFLFTSPQFLTPLDANDIPYLVLKYASPLPQAPIFSNTSTENLTNELRVGYGDYNTLRLSVLSYKFTSGIISGTTHSYRMDAAVLYNEFNSNVINQLKANDTLAVQESYLTLKSR